jgi:AraC-like DNA-binding protein
VKARDQVKCFELVADALEDDLFGFHIGLTTDLREIGWLYYVLSSSETISQALQRGARYSSIVNEAIVLQYFDQGEGALGIQYVGVSRHIDRHQIECISTLLVRLLRQLTGIQQVPVGARFIHRRQGVPAELAAFFGPAVEFAAAADEIILGARIKRSPVISADPYLNELLITFCEEAFARRRSCSASFRSKVENAIVPLLPHGKPRAAEIAARLGVGQRTVARQLSLEGTNFSEVLDRLRADLAGRYLADRGLSVSEIAWLLGYREISAFTHAFKRWTGKTPREARTCQTGVGG